MKPNNLADCLEIRRMIFDSRIKFPSKENTPTRQKVVSAQSRKEKDKEMRE